MSHFWMAAEYDEQAEATVRDLARAMNEIPKIVAQTFVQQDLLDEIHLDLCPVILGAGKPLFTDLTHHTYLRLRQAVTYASGATTMYYEVVKTS